MQQIVTMLSYGLILLFGIAVSFRFSGAEPNKKNLTGTVCVFLLTLFLQIVCRQLFGLERTKELYPLIVHLPLIVFLVVFLKRSWLVSLSSVFSAYLCCQIPKWFASTGEAMFRSEHVFFMIYIPAMVIVYIFLHRIVAAPVSRIMNQSKKSCLLFGAVPFSYYIFDYGSTIYTDWLYSGDKIAVQFIPSVVSVFYFVFVLIYYAETQKEKMVQQERDLIAAQFKEAKTEFDTLSRMQEQTRQYRHDMRHHFTLLQGLAAKGDLEQIAGYLQTVQSDLDAFTPTRYCENETVNLLLSYFETLAKQAGVALFVEAGVPNPISISDTELCSLLSNSLENAIVAASAVPEAEKRTVSVQVTVYKDKLLLAVENPYAEEISFQKGLPQTSRPEHGYGTRSIAAMAELHGGQALFSANAGVFSLKVMIPLK